MGTAKKRKFSAAARREVVLPPSLRPSPAAAPARKTARDKVVDEGVGLLRKQADALLETLRKSHAKRCRRVSELCKAVEAISEEPHKLSWWRARERKAGLAIPFASAPPDDCLLDFAVRPSQVAQRCGRVYVVMGDVQDKDYLNHRIFWKAAVYAFAIASRLGGQCSGTTVSIDDQVIEVVAPDAFDRRKLEKDRNCDRAVDGPTPEYNARVCALTDGLPAAEHADAHLDAWLLVERFISLRHVPVRTLDWRRAVAPGNALAAFRATLEKVRKLCGSPECARAVRLLDSAVDRRSQLEAFAALFLIDVRADGWDVVVRGEIDEARLKTALGQRVDRMARLDEESVGLLLSERAHDPMTLGPASVDPASAAFRAFWGDRSELRKFKDGRILECVVHGHDPVGECCMHAVPGLQLTVRPPREVVAAIGRRTAQQDFDELARRVQSMEDLPLRVTQMTRSSANEALIEFESSGRWPDDLEALQRTKAAMLLACAGPLNGRVAREPDTTSHYLQLQIGSQPYAVRIRHERERQLTAEDGWAAWDRRYELPRRHRPVIGALEGRQGSFPAALDYLDAWLSAHLLDRHVSREWRECLLSHVYLRPGMLDPPRSARLAFARVLRLLARWDWRTDPLAVPFSDPDALEAGEILTGDALARLHTDADAIFDRSRAKDGAMRRVGMVLVPSYDRDLRLLQPPNGLISLRLTQLAKSCVAVLDTPAMYVTPLGDYDVVLELTPPPRYKNLSDDGEWAAIQQLWLDDLDRVYGDVCTFFAGRTTPPSDDKPALGGYTHVGVLFDRVLLREGRFKVNQNFNATPVDGDTVKLDVRSMVAEIERLGEGIVQRVVVR